MIFELQVGSSLEFLENYKAQPKPKSCLHNANLPTWFQYQLIQKKPAAVREGGLLAPKTF